MARGFKIHVWAPALEVQRKFDPKFPTVAIREILDDGSTSDDFILVDRVDMKGNSTLGPGDPLSGTNGRAACFLQTNDSIHGYIDSARYAYGIEHTYNLLKQTPQQIIRKVLRKRYLPKELRA